MPNYKRKIRRAARREGVRPRLLVSQLRAESGLNPNAVSPAGAKGIAQFMPGTAASYGVNLNDNNPNDDIRGAARLMHDLLRQFGGDERKALAAYNAGPGAVQKYGGVPPYAETRAYVSKILKAAGHGGGGGMSAARTGPSYATTSRTVPGIDNGPLRQQLKLQYLSQSHDPNALLQLASGLKDAQDTPDRTVTTTRRIRSSGTQPRGATGFGGKVITAPNADRPGVHTQKPVRQFVRAISRLYGQPLTIGTGTNHSQMTVNGNQSDHWTGHAADIPLAGKALVRAGQDALIAAGMPRKKARQQTGGLFNVNGHQIIFNTHIGGDHTNHLHVGLQGSR